MRKLRFDYLSPVKLAAVATPSGQSREVESAWRQLFEWLTRGQHLTENGLGYGLTFTDPQATGLSARRYLAGVELPRSWRRYDKKMVAEKQFDGGAYIILDHLGPFSQIANVTDYLEQNWSPSSRMAFDHDRPIVTLYHNDPHATPDYQQSAEICVPIKPIKPLKSS